MTEHTFDCPKAVWFMQVALGLQHWLTPTMHVCSEATQLPVTTCESSTHNWMSGVMTEQEDPLTQEPRPPKQLEVVHRAATVGAVERGFVDENLALLEALGDLVWEILG